MTFTSAPRIDHTQYFLESPCRQASDCHLFALDEAGVVFCEGRQEIYAFNTSATWIWMAMEDGLPVTAIAAELAEITDSPHEQTQDTVINLVGQWWALGLLSGSERNRPVLTRPPARSLPQVDLQVDRVRVHRKKTYRLRRTLFTIGYGAAEQESMAHPILAHLEDDETAACNTELILAQTNSGYAVLRDGIIEEFCETLSGLGPAVKCCMMRIALNDHPYRFQIHGGVVERDGQCVVLPAESGSGKTCLVAGLVHDGWHYLSDECAPLEGNELRVQPIPIAMATKEGAWPVLAPYYPELDQATVHLREDGKHIRYLSPPPESRGPDRPEGHKVRWIVFPAYNPAAQSELQPLPRVEILQRLFAQCLSLPERLNQAAVSRIVEWIRTIDGYLLPNSNLKEAVRLMNKLTP